MWAFTHACSDRPRDPFDSVLAWPVDRIGRDSGGVGVTEPYEDTRQPILKKIICCDCGAEVVMRAANQKRCSPCGVLKAKQSTKTALRKRKATKRRSGVHCSRCCKPTGVPGVCEQCRNYVAQWKRSKPERVAAIAKAKRDRERVPVSPEQIEARKRLSLQRQNDLRRRKRATRRAKTRGANNRLTPGLTIRLMALQGGKCVYCRGKLVRGFHVDHIVPLALDGLNEDTNIQLLCVACNLSKSATHPIEFAQSRGLLL